jgi:histidine triad (HIT) family protein
MPTIFTRIIDGEVPGRFVWSDDICVAFMDVRPLGRGHVLVVPRVEVDHWIDLDAETCAHLVQVARAIATAQKAALSPARVGLVIAGFEVPHAHVHVVPAASMDNLDFHLADENPDQADLDVVADLLRETLRAQGHGSSVPG